jgi:hypothetical protein
LVYGERGEDGPTGIVEPLRIRYTGVRLKEKDGADDASYDDEDTEDEDE